MQVHTAAVEARRALTHHFTVDREPLKRVEAFKYLGWLMLMDNINRQEINANLQKARRCWGRLLHLLRMDNVSPQNSDMFYKAVVIAALLYRSKS